MEFQLNKSALEKADNKVIDSAFEKIVGDTTTDAEFHFVYAGRYYLSLQDKLTRKIIEGLKRYGASYVVFTLIYGRRLKGHPKSVEVRFS